MRINEVYQQYIDSPTPVTRDRLGEALYYYIKAIIAKEFGTRFISLQDAIGESSVKILSHLDMVDSSKGNFASWVYAITCNTCLDMRRKHTRRNEQILLDDGTGSTKPTIFDRLFLADLLAGLTEFERTLVELKAEKVLNEDIAERMGVTVDAVKSHWKRLQFRLRTQVGGGLNNEA